ncbi:hypothetical protein [Lysobacter gummosus]|uniref:Uncharacterized protein n=1 Tax=Lysobacter gummosus TaxID=262324 RepID=A0ABY3X9B8_9GAMM|nr:hypothetical protein [Lysobacter gummosus]ALN93760.1 hypothetical protein LG3211_4826 [Lysobacter gummosus]UNP29193.1 hypothetical protein MOV92_22435 [Lysobacter gummosus]
MTAFVITWNLNKERENYAQARKDFIAHLERHANVGESGMESVRWISTTYSVDQICNDLRTKMDKNGRIFVSQVVSGTHHG